MAKQHLTARHTGIAAGILLLIAVGFLPYFWIRESFLTAWQNMIGILYETDPQLCAETVPHLFEEGTFQKRTQAGEDAMVALGYTKKGTAYLFRHSGLNRICLSLPALNAIAALVLSCILLRRKKQRTLQEELLAGEIRNAKIQQTELPLEHSPFFQAMLLSEISDTLRLLHAKERLLQQKTHDTQMFLENVAHQIKTPLSCISTSLDLVLEEAVPAQKKRISECFGYLDGIGALLKRLLDIGRLEAGKTILRREPFRMEQLLEECKYILPDGEQRILLSAEVTKNPKAPYYGDYEWLKEAFLNILKNCLEHDKSGAPVSVMVSRNAEGIKVTVRDRGPGISPQDLPFIFDRFYLPEHVKKSHSGIGLNLAKLIIEKHFGVFHAANHEQGGAVFTIVLPVFALKNEKL